MSRDLIYIYLLSKYRFVRASCGAFIASENLVRELGIKTGGSDKGETKEAKTAVNANLP